MIKAQIIMNISTNPNSYFEIFYYIIFIKRSMLAVILFSGAQLRTTVTFSFIDTCMHRVPPKNKFAKNYGVTI